MADKKKNVAEEVIDPKVKALMDENEANKAALAKQKEADFKAPYDKEAGAAGDWGRFCPPMHKK